MHYPNNFNHNIVVVGIIGHPIKHSFSPLMHNISFELNELPFKYLPFDVPPSNLKDAIKGMKSLGIKGFNVTLPHKEKIIQFLHDVSDEASVIGSVNTIVNDNGVLQGYNTDVNGVNATLESFKDEINETEVTVIGAGGAARSVIYSLIRNLRAGKINLVNRTSEKAESLKDHFGTKMHFDNIKTYELVPPDLVDIFSRSKLIVNTTSIGMDPDTDDSPTNIQESFNKNQIVLDIVYNPLETKFLKLAGEQGATTVNGLKMFVEQGKIF